MKELVNVLKKKEELNESQDVNSYDDLFLLSFLLKRISDPVKRIDKK